MTKKSIWPDRKERKKPKMTPLTQEPERHYLDDYHIRSQSRISFFFTNYLFYQQFDDGCDPERLAENFLQQCQNKGQKA